MKSEQGMPSFSKTNPQKNIKKNGIKTGKSSFAICGTQKTNSNREFPTIFMSYTHGHKCFPTNRYFNIRTI